LLFILASLGRVAALCLVGSGGLGREVSSTLAAISEPVLDGAGRRLEPDPRRGHPARLGPKPCCSCRKATPSRRSLLGNLEGLLGTPTLVPNRGTWW